MGFFGGGGGGVKTPPLPPTPVAPPIPAATDTSGDMEIKRAKRRSGYEMSILGESFEKKDKKATLG